jgi:hypothetical protein
LVVADIDLPREQSHFADHLFVAANIAPRMASPVQLLGFVGASASQFVQSVFTTTNEIPATAQSLALVPNTAVTLWVKVVAVRTDAGGQGNTANFVQLVKAKRVADVVSISVIDTIGTDQSDEIGPGVLVTAIGSALNVTVTGNDGETFAWNISTNVFVSPIF